MPRKKVTSRFRGTDIFSRRIVITISRSGVLLIALAMVLSITFSMWTFPLAPISIVALIASVVAIITTIEARHQLRTFRYEMQDRITAQLSDWFIPDDLPDLRELPLDDDEFDAAIRRITLRGKNAPND